MQFEKQDYRPGLRLEAAGGPVIEGRRSTITKGAFMTVDAPAMAQPLNGVALLTERLRSIRKMLERK